MTEILITRSDEGRTIEANPGDVILIRLEENISTGYAWQVANPASPVVELVDSNYKQAPGIRLGSSGMRTLRFRAKSEGTAQIQLSLQRPWESEDPAADRFAINVRVGNRLQN